MADITLIPKDYKGKVEVTTIFSKIGILAFALLILSLLVYGGLFFLKGSLDSQLSELQSQIEEINKKRDIEFEEKVIPLEKTLKNLKIVLKNHFYWSNFVSKFESFIVPQATLSSFNGKSLEDGSVDLMLNGMALGYTYLAKQMVSFIQDDLVSDIKVSKITLGTEGGIEFALDINFKKGILLK